MCPKYTDAPALAQANLARFDSFIEVPKAGASVYCGHISSLFFVFVFIYFTGFQMDL